MLTSNAVLGNSLEIFHQINPCLTNAYIRSDNAGCFHGAASVCAMPFLSSIVQCKKMDFADPQGGKSICDRKAAHVKSYIRKYVNEGNDVCTAVDFKNALMKSNIKKVSVVVALQPLKSDSKKKEPTVFKLPKITTVNNFSYKNGGVQDMRIARTTSERKRFSQEEFLSATQIASYFSRLVLNKRKLYNPLYTADDEQAETADAEFIELNLVAAY
ncbi:Hypothetical predicted protein [Mytilus galloprovincialis]|uniref:Uncharacterized protein n=1 Tax=Mytilus galloprovincialis TaxID=29158 RepID=A0A8B6CI70_MYTGA|nr:Hypothetical predicted protein [Mytilus galloprovincialis]